MAEKNWVYVLKGEPKNIMIVDKHGKKRYPNLEEVKKNERLIPSVVLRVGVGNLFYGGILGDRESLEARGNEYTTNHKILMALGFTKGAQLNPPKDED